MSTPQKRPSLSQRLAQRLSRSSRSESGSSARKPSLDTTDEGNKVKTEKRVSSTSRAVRKALEDELLVAATMATENILEPGTQSDQEPNAAAQNPAADQQELTWGEGVKAAAEVKGEEARAVATSYERLSDAAPSDAAPDLFCGLRVEPPAWLRSFCGM